jgi:DNA-binding transcriptional LysR family regulator
MEINELRYFYHVAQAKSFSRGAELSHVSPPAISKAIRKLEEELETRLFARTTRRVALTDSGEILLAHCHQLFRKLADIRRDLDEADTVLRGDLRIATNEVFSIFLLPSALGRMVREHPRLTPRCFQMGPEQIQHGLVNGELDLGLTVGSETLKGVSTEVIAECPGVLVCGINHPLYEAGTVAPQDLLDYPSVVPRHWQQDYLTHIDQFPDGRMPRRIGATTELMQLGVQLCVEGAYLGYFPEVAIGCQIRHSELKVLDGLPTGRPFRLKALTPPGTPPRASAKLLIAELRTSIDETLRAPCGWQASP